MTTETAGISLQVDANEIIRRQGAQLGELQTQLCIAQVGNDQLQSMVADRDSVIANQMQQLQAFQIAAAANAAAPPPVASVVGDDDALPPGTEEVGGLLLPMGPDDVVDHDIDQQ